MSGSERQRRYRVLRKSGAIVIPFRVEDITIEGLIVLGDLDALQADIFAARGLSRLSALAHKRFYPRAHCSAFADSEHRRSPLARFDRAHR
jgi:hypothetical protein